MSAWATLMPDVSDRRGYVRYGSGRNNYCDCVDCVARASLKQTDPAEDDRGAMLEIQAA